nr:hypothetical protein Iba_chr04eCG0950 [Ipomoea batatas]
MVEAVAGNDCVDGALVGSAGAVGARAGEGNLQGVREVVSAKDRSEVLDIEEGFHGGESGGIGRDIVYNSVASAVAAAAFEGRRLSFYNHYQGGNAGYLSDQQTTRSSFD